MKATRNYYNMKLREQREEIDRLREALETERLKKKE